MSPAAAASLFSIASAGVSGLIFARFSVAFRAFSRVRDPMIILYPALDQRMASPVPRSPVPPNMAIVSPAMLLPRSKRPALCRLSVLHR